MADKDIQDTPKLVWTFPLISRFQTRSGILNVEGWSSSTVERAKEVKESKPVREKVSDTLTDDGKSDSVNEIEEELDNIQDSSDSLFSESDDSLYSEDDEDIVYGQDSDDLHTIEIADDTFVPKRLNIEEGTEVTWVNNDDSIHRLITSSGEEFSSNQIEPDEEFTHTFDSEGVTMYFDTIEGASEMCGAIIVGDAELTEDLPCEVDVSRELLGDSSNTEMTMSAAAERKEEMDVGF